MGEIGFVKKRMFCIDVDDARDILHGLQLADKTVGPRSHDHQRIVRHINELREFVRDFGTEVPSVGGDNRD